jgi:hypothetical protein
MNEPTKTPETDAHQLKPEMAYDRLWSDFARKLERERDELREALSGRTVSCSRCNEAAAVAALDERDRLMRENERLQAHLDELTASTIHSCGDHCQRPNCVRRREMAAMREAIREAEAALRAWPKAGSGMSTDFNLQSQAFRTGQQALAKLKPFTTP